MSNDSAQDANESPRRKAERRVGTRVRSRWHLDALLGVGGMGAVYAATHEDGSRAALKIMHVELSRHDDISARFSREGHVARQVDHPGVLRIFDDDVTEHGEPFLVLELLEGQTLAERCRDLGTTLTVDEAMHIAESVLGALAAFHAVGVVHRDLKPANIFITHDGQVKILDFGVAQFREKGQDMTALGLAMGTAAYMAPEQALGISDRVDSRADIYALGATLYTVLSGRRLHQGSSPQESHVLAATQPAPSIARVAPDLPVELVTIIDKALQWDQRNRYQTAEEMRDAIAAWRGHADVAALLPVADVPRTGEQRTRIAPSELRRVVPGVVSVGPPLAAPPRPPQQPPVAVASHPSLAAAPRKSDDVPLDPSHPLAALFTGIDRMLRTARQYGPAHPETQSRLGPVFDLLRAALEGLPEGLQFKVLPFCFAHEGETLWEPSPPGDLVPYTLSVAGLREVHISHGVTDEELRELFGTMMIDANTDAAEIATALWEAPFRRIRCHIEGEIGGEDVDSLEQFLVEAQDLERQLHLQLSDAQKLALELAREDVLEAAAMASMSGARGDAGDELGLDPETLEELAGVPPLTSVELRARHVAVLLAAFVDASTRRDADALREAADAYAGRLVRLGRHDDLFETHRALIAQLQDGRPRSSRLNAAFVTAQLFHNDVIAHIVRVATGWGDLLGDEQRARAREGLDLIAKTAGPDVLPFFLDLADRASDEKLLEILLGYVTRVSLGEEQQVIDQLERLNPVIAQRILEGLIERGGARVRAMLEPLRNSPNSALRCEAIAQLAASPRELADELIQLFQSEDRDVRWAALDAFARHDARSAGPALVRLVAEDSFSARPLDDQRRFFEALFTLNRSRTETLLGQLLGKHGLVPSETIERTRTLAAQMLGERARTREALAALEAAASRRLWNSAELREVAGLAARGLAARLAAGSKGTTP